MHTKKEKDNLQSDMTWGRLKRIVVRRQRGELIKESRGDVTEGVLRICDKRYFNIPGAVLWCIHVFCLKVLWLF